MREPQDGTLRAAILQHLRAHPHEAFRPPQIAELLGKDPNAVSATMRQMYDAGAGLLVRCEVTSARGQRCHEYRVSAADGTPHQAPPRKLVLPGSGPPAHQVRAPSAQKAPHTPEVSAAAGLGRAVEAAFLAQHNGGYEKGETRFMAALCSDGTMQLCGVETTQRGVRLTSEQVETIRRLLTGVPPV